MRTYAIFGITNSGKTTFIDDLIQHDGIEAAQVGKEFRRRYPPGHFKGQGAPAHTEQEALDILDELTAAARDKGCTTLLIDGQPRREDQVAEVLKRFPNLRIIWLTASDKEIEARARARAKTEEDLELNLDRINNDKIQLFPVLAECTRRGVSFRVVTPDGVERAKNILRRVNDIHRGSV